MYLGSTYLRNLVETSSSKINPKRHWKVIVSGCLFRVIWIEFWRWGGYLALIEIWIRRTSLLLFQWGQGGQGGGYIIPTVPISSVGPELSSQFHAWSSHRNSYPAVLSSTSLLFWHLFHLSLCSFAKTISHCSFLLLHTFSPSKE